MSHLEDVAQILSEETGRQSLLNFVVVLDAGLQVGNLDAVHDGREAFRLHQWRIVLQACDDSGLHEVTVPLDNLHKAKHNQIFNPTFYLIMDSVVIIIFIPSRTPQLEVILGNKPF